MAARREGRGHLVVFEGPEGAGKSTQLAALSARLIAAGYDTLFTREPGGTPAGEAIRRVVLDPTLRVDPLPEFLLYSAARAQHVADVIAPALAAGRDVVCDRFTAASVAYQGYGRGLDLGFVAELNARVTGGLEADLTVLLDIDPAAGLARASGRAAHDRLEAAGLAFHRRVRSGFVAQADADGGRRWVRIDAEAAEAVVTEAVWRAVSPLLAPGEVGQ
ncbi:MAG: dTMP kinase [Trueperaceae bacterium]|nr:dTMP kinase [Trueperaceae bacterium]MCO5172619.1 dTMP kinase [Trueperaceae bacterium]